MEFVKIIGIGFITCFAGLIVKQIKPEFFLVVILCGSVAILLMMISQIEHIVNYFSSIINKTHIDYSVFQILLKVLGIAYLTEFASSVCSDAGSNSIADKIVIAGKITILCLILPIIKQLLDAIIEFLP